ncbi:MAG: hypothetical protein NW237_03980 [Cyanobacteriota bacterium]|nr:hypothetical protein [Cyanobacteriota bacterium]
MSEIVQFVEKVLQEGAMGEMQERQLLKWLQQDSFSAAELEALDALLSAAVTHKIRRCYVTGSSSPLSTSLGSLGSKGQPD